MSAGGDDQVTRNKDDSMKFVDSLLDMKLQDTVLDQQATEDLAARCLAKFDDTEADPKCRAISLYTLLAQIRAGNVSMLPLIPDLCQRLKASSVLTQPVTDAAAEDFHRQIINTISVILDLSPEKLVDESFGAAMHYLVQLVSCKHVEIAIMACKFWAKYAGISANITIRKHWLSLLFPEMSLLIKALMDQMIYHPAYAEHIEKFGSRCLNAAASEESLPGNVEAFVNLRNLAAVAFEHVVRVYPADLVCATFRPLLEKRIESDSWPEKEAVILALAAFTQGGGTPDAMRDSYSLLIPRVLDCYADPHPLLRSVACLAMPKLVGRQLRGVKDPWSRVLTSTARATRDSSAAVRRTAIHALSSLLAYGTPSGAAGPSSGVGDHTGKLVDALVRADQYDMDPDTRCVYFECVSHLVGRTNGWLTAADMDRLMPPLIDAWRSQPWDRAMDAKKTGSIIDPDLGIVPFSVALGTIATYGKSLFIPFAESVFEKACTDIKGCVFNIPNISASSTDRDNILSYVRFRATVRTDDALLSCSYCVVSLLYCCCNAFNK